MVLKPHYKRFVRCRPQPSEKTQILMHSAMKDFNSNTFISERLDTLWTPHNQDYLKHQKRLCRAQLASQGLVHYESIGFDTFKCQSNKYRIGTQLAPNRYPNQTTIIYINNLNSPVEINDKHI